MPDDARIDRRHSTDKIRVDYPHVGLFDTDEGRLWIARKKWGTSPVRVSHAKLLVGGTQDTSTINKDHFLCYWFHTPGSGEGNVHGYPIEWDEGHLLVRLDPNWDYRGRKLIRSEHAARVEKNIDQQYKWGRRIFERYVAKKPDYPIAWHMVGPRPTDSMFYVERVEPD